MKPSLLLIITAMIFNNAVSQTIDSSFGKNGIVITELSQGVDALHAMALQPDGKIIASGFSNSRLTLVRYNTTGLLDSAFGTNGIVNTSFVCGFGSTYNVSLQANGKIVLLGMNSSTMLLTRYNNNGTLDRSFGMDGIANITQSIAGSYCSSMKLLANDKIIVTGSIGIDSIFLIKYNTNGDLDASFGTQGFIKTIIPTGYTSITAGELCIESDGSILVAANIASQPGGYANFCFLKYHSNGTVNTNFGSNGFVVFETGGINMSGFPAPIQLQKDGKILLAATANTNFVIARFNRDGSLDNTFNATGIAATNVGGIYRKCADMIIEPNGKIVLAGFIGDDFGSIRVNKDGTLDSSYGTNGIFKIDFGSSYDYGNVIIRQPDNKFVMGGWSSFFCSNRAFGLIRFSASPSEPEEPVIANDISVFPNPSASLINIASKSVLASIALYDTQGRVLLYRKENSNTAIVDISGQQRGVYFLKIYYEGGSKTKKVVKE
jgi:uncharacterized delta-60 repeat protein